MFELIEKVRQKPERTKKQIAFGTAFVFAGCILVLWLTVIFPDFKRSQDRQNRPVDGAPSPVSTFAATLSSGISTIGNQVSEVKKVSGSLSRFLSGVASISTSTISTSTKNAISTGIYTGQ